MIYQWLNEKIGTLKNYIQMGEDISAQNETQFQTLNRDMEIYTQMLN